MACYAFNARAQENAPNNYLRFYNDSTVYAQKIRLRPDYAGSWIIRADSRRIPIAQVKFFNNEDGFFANTRQLNFFGDVSFSERIIEGKINLYQQVVYEQVPYDNDYRFRRGVIRSVDTRMFYNKGFDNLKKVNYDNLKGDMADNQKSLDFLEAYRKSRKNATLMYVGAGVSFVAAAITLFSWANIKQTGTTGFGNMPTYDTKSPAGSFVLFGVGSGLALGGYLTQAAGARNIERAVDAYNR